jgi:pilus assembly protein CpaB
MRGKSVFLLLLAIGCGLVASIGITQVMSSNHSEQPAPAEMGKIVVAIKDLPMGDPVSAESLKLEDWPKDKVPPGAFTSLDDVVKRRSKTRVFSGSPVLENQFFGKGDTDNAVGSHIPPGYRVLSIEVNGVSSAGGLIRAGDRVDLLLSVRSDPSRGLNETSTRTILQDIKVFAVDGRYRLDADDLDKASAAKNVSLLLTPEQAQRVTLAAELGTLRLSMRGSVDQKQPLVNPARPNELFGGTDGSHRDAERESTHPAANPDDLLKSYQRASQPKPRDEKKVYTVRVLAGARLSDVQLELADSSPSDGSDSVTKIWRPRAPTNEGRPETEVAAAGADSPVPPGPDPGRGSPTANKPARSPQTDTPGAGAPGNAGQGPKAPAGKSAAS